MSFYNWFPFASLLILMSLILSRIIFLKYKGIKVSSGSAKKNKSLLLLYPVFMLILLMWFFEITKPAFHISFSVLPETLTNPLVDSLFLKISGVLTIVFALVFLQLALLHFNNSLRFGLDENNKGELITTGIFSLSRNPFFLSLDLYFMGVALLLPSVFFISYSVLVVVSIHFFMLKEEKFMLKIYGGEYREYLRKVRRYI